MKVCAKVLSRLWSCSGQVSVSRIPIETRRTTKNDEEKKNEQKGFKGSSTGPPGEEIPRVPLRDLRGGKKQEKKTHKTGTYHWEKHIACFMHICNVRSQVFFPGVWVCLRDFILYIYFFCSLEREPSLWENTWPWEILRIWESFPGIRLGNQDLWGGGKESTFDTGMRVETGTYRWEGRKPFIQTFEWLTTPKVYQTWHTIYMNIKRLVFMSVFCCFSMF